MTKPLKYQIIISTMGNSSGEVRLTRYVNEHAIHDALVQAATHTIDTDRWDTFIWTMPSEVAIDALQDISLRRERDYYRRAHCPVHFGLVRLIDENGNKPLPKQYLIDDIKGLASNKSEVTFISTNIL